MHAGDFDGPRRRACIEEGLAESLQHAGEINAGNSQGREIDGASRRAARQAGHEDVLASAVVRQRSGEETRAQRHEGENADDEAHRFVIGGHRKKRSAAIGANPLDEVAGVGAGRKRALLQHFGSARAVAAASLTDLQSVAGVSGTLAKKIYDFFHPGG